MLFAHDTEPSLRAAVRLVNSAGEPDTLTTVAHLREFYDEEGYTGHKPTKRAELDDVRELRPRLRALLVASRDEVARRVNEILEESTVTPHLARHDGLDWHLHVVPDTAGFADRVKIETAMAMIDALRADELSRLSICAAEGCDGIVLDLTRNRSKIFCSPTCSNAAAVAAYRERARQKASQG